MKLPLLLLALGASLLILAGCSLADVSRAIDMGSQVLLAIAPLIPGEKMAALNEAIAQGAPIAATAFGAVADVLQSLETETAARLAEQARVIAAQAIELGARITTGEAVMLSAGTGLSGGGVGTGVSRWLSAQKHGFSGRKPG